MIINWWQLLGYSKLKIWQGPPFWDYSKKIYDGSNYGTWIWWNNPMGIRACQSFYKQLLYSSIQTTNINIKELLKSYLLTCDHEPCCGRGWSDVFYIPKRFQNEFIFLSTLAYKNQVFLEIAVPTILGCLDKSDQFEKLNGLFLFEMQMFEFVTKRFWSFYNHNITFIHPFKYDVKGNINGALNVQFLEKYVINYTNILLMDKSN